MDVFLGPVELKKNETYGRYYTASRAVEPGETILEETTVLSFPWSTDKSTAICMSCFQKLDSTPINLCSKCQWPVCNSTCESAREHAEAECGILEKNGVTFEGTERKYAYSCIETLRGLLAGEKCEKTLKQIMNLEPHIEARDERPDLAEEIAYVVDFIRNKLKLEQFDEATIKQVFGAIEVNTFIGPGKDAQSCLMFPTCSMLNHDCSPNTSRTISKIEIEDQNKGPLTAFKIKVVANKHIEEGEVISTNYGSISIGVVERRERLKKYFFFDCDCDRCKSELSELTEKLS